MPTDLLVLIYNSLLNMKKTILALALCASFSVFADDDNNYRTPVVSTYNQSSNSAVAGSASNSTSSGGNASANPTATGGVSSAYSNSISGGGAGGTGGTANSNAVGGVGIASANPTATGGTSNATGGTGGISYATGGLGGQGGSGGNATGGMAAGGTGIGGSASSNPTATGGNASASPTANATGGTSSASPTSNAAGGNAAGGTASANPTASANGTINVGCLTNCGANETDKEIAAGHDAAIITAAGVTQTIKNTPALFAPALTSSNDTCMGSTSGGVSTPGFGLSIGSSWVDTNCKMLKNSRELWNMGFKAAALALMCTDATNKEALELTGFECPQTTRDKQQTK